MKSQFIKINLARLSINQDCVDAAMIAISEQRRRIYQQRSRDPTAKQQIHLLVSTNTAGVLYQNLQRLSNEFTQVTVERVLVPDDETNAEEMN